MPVLDSLIKSEIIDLTAVVTQPDKPVGRRKILTPVPVRKYIVENNLNIQVYTPHLYRKIQEVILKEQMPELIIVADYGQLLPEYTIDYPKYKCLNIHGSLLPDLRGAAPIPLAILNGYEKTGVSIPVMTGGLDNGPVIAMREAGIDPSENAGELKKKLSLVGAALLVEILPAWIEGRLEPMAQDNSKATIADKSMIEKKRAQIFKATPGDVAYRMIRAFNPWPVAWGELEVRGTVNRFKIFSAKLSDLEIQGEEGEIRNWEKKLYLILKEGVLELGEVQLEGKRKGGFVEYAYLASQKAKIVN